MAELSKRLAKSNPMMKRPTFPSFLLRSRAFWLTMVTLLFFSWAWWDSINYYSLLGFTPKQLPSASLLSINGGIQIECHPFDKEYRLGLTMVRTDNNRLRALAGLFPIEDKPSFHYSSLMIFTIALSISWHLWRWSRMKKSCVVDAGLGRDG